MKRILALGVLLMMSLSLFAQDAAALAERRAAEERERRLTSAMEELREANLVQQRRINSLNNDNVALQRQVADMENKFRNAQMGAVTREDLQKVYAKLAEVEKARQADRTAMLEQINKLADKLAELAARPPQVIQVREPTPPRTVTRTPEPATSDQEDTMPENKEGFYRHKVKKGEYLTTIISAYNAQLKEKFPNKKAITLDAVKKANPKMNVNNLQVDKEILIPIPPDK